MSLLHLIRRLLRQRLVTISLLAGLALAVALGVAVPLATNALVELGLRSTLGAIPRTAQQIQLFRSREPFDPQLREDMLAQLGPLAAESFTVGSTAELPVVSTPELGLQLRLRSQEGLAERIDVRDTPTGAPGAHRVPEGECTGELTVRALLSEEQTARSNLAVGDELCVASRMVVQIAGTFTPKNPDDVYWQFDATTLRGKFEADAGGISFVPILITDDATFAALTDLYAAGRPVLALPGRGYSSRANSYNFNVLTAPATITVDNVAQIAARIATFRGTTDVAEPRISTITGIDKAIVTYNNRLQLMRSALLILLIEIVLLAMLYVVVVGRLAVDQQSAEIALLRSRGSTRRQLVAGQLLQGIVLLVPGALLGLGLGTAGALALGRTSLFQALRGGQFELRLTPDIALAVGLIAVIALAAMLLAARPALAQSLVTLRRERARPLRIGGWQPIQRDVVLTILAVVGWWQLRRAGSSLSIDVNGVAQLNLLLLAAPALLLLAASLLFLRLFPLAVRGFGRLLGRDDGIVAPLSAWQLARNPSLYGRLVLLLTLAVGLGVYTQTTLRTIGRQQLRQALDEAGADVRVPLDGERTIQEIAATYPQATVAQLTTRAAEVRLPDDPSQRQRQDAALVGMDGATLRNVLLQSGSDDRPLLAALQTLSSNGREPPLGAPLPAGTTEISVPLSGDAQNITVFAVIAGVDGVREVPLGAPTGPAQAATGAIPQDLDAPLAFQSILVRSAGKTAGRSATGIGVGPITAVVGGERVAVADPAQLDQWEALGSGTVSATEPGAENVGVGGVLRFTTLNPSDWAVLRPRLSATLPVFGSAQAGNIPLQAGQELRLLVGEQPLDATVQGIVASFPGGGDNRRNTLLADGRRLDALLTYGIPTTSAPTELRLALPAGAPAELRRLQLSPDTVTKAIALEGLAADPLSAGVQVVLVLGAVCTAVLSLLGVVIHAALTIQSRHLEWAVLRAMGLSGRQLLMLLAAEQSFVLVGGTLAGALVGLLLTTVTQPFVQVVTRSAAPTVAVDWQGLGVIALGLLIALGLTLAVLALSVQRRGALAALRLGEEG